MTERQARAFNSIKTVLALVKHRSATPALDSLTRELADCAGRIEALRVEQDQSGRRRTLDVKAVDRLHRDLRHRHMLPIARRAKLLLKGLNGVAPAMKVPHARATIAELVDAAKAMAKAVRPYEKSFREVGFPAGFLSALRADAAALAKSGGSSDSALQLRARATADLRRELTHGHDLALAIEGQLLSDMDANPHLAKDWKARRRIYKKTGRKNGPKD